MTLTKDIPNRHIVLYFQVHQPKRLREMDFFEIGGGHASINHSINSTILRRISRECYIPANTILLNLIRKYPQIRVAFSISGTTLDQLEEYAPEVITSFGELARTGCVEFLAETYHHSLACRLPDDEFEIQVNRHAKKIEKLFGQKPRVFRNTGLIYDNEIGERISDMGYLGVVTAGVEKALGLNSPYHLYQHPEKSDLKILLRSCHLSDDVAFRFNEAGSILTADKYMTWLASIPASEEVVNVALDYETFGEHQKRDNSVMKFLEELMISLAKQQDFLLSLPSDVIRRLAPTANLSVPETVSWEDEEKDLSAWLGNDIQCDAFETLLKLGDDVKATNDDELIELWRNLQTSDHFYYMCTKQGNDGNVHSYFSPYSTPYEAFINYMNILSDLAYRVRNLASAQKEDYSASEIDIQSNSAPIWSVQLAPINFHRG